MGKSIFPTADQAFEKGMSDFTEGVSQDSPPTGWTDLQQELWLEGWGKAEQQLVDMFL